MSNKTQTLKTFTSQTISSQVYIVQDKVLSINSSSTATEYIFYFYIKLSLCLFLFSIVDMETEVELPKDVRDCALTMSQNDGIEEEMSNKK